MLRRPRPLAAAPLRAAVVPLGVLALGLSATLTACGTQTTPAYSGFADGLDAVSIGGEGERTPTLEWEQQMNAGDADDEVLVEGEGEPLEDGDTMTVNYLLADGFSQKTEIDTYGPKAPAVQLEVGEEPAEPQTADDILTAFLRDYLTAGVTRGTRIAVTVNAEVLFGQGALSPAVTSLGIGNQDGLLVVADVVDFAPLAGPRGPAQAPPEWVPGVVKEDGVPVRLDFADVPEPSAELRRAVLVQGSGPQVRKGDLITVDYLGQIPDGDAPFDESFSKKPFTTPIGLGRVVAGWDKKLVGVPVGSRVVLEIPPDDGYGEEGSGEDIPGGSTLYFVIDVLATA